MKFILIIQFLLLISFVSTGQTDSNILSTKDSLALYFKSFELKPLYRSGGFDEGCKIFEELLTNDFYNRGILLYGGKCCFKSNKDSLVKKMFTEKFRSIIQDFCNLNWGDKVKRDTSYINFCEVDIDKYQSTLRSVLNLKSVSDTLVRILIEDQGSMLSNGLKNNLIKSGYEKLFTIEAPKLNPVALNNRHIKIIERILITYPNLSKEDVGVYGMQGLNFALLHSKIENLQKFESVYKRLFGKSAQAYYQDKILVAKGEPQMYGTQFRYCELFKKNLLYPVFDIENLNVRRMRMGMDLIEDYAKYNGIENYLEKCE